MAIASAESLRLVEPDGGAAARTPPHSDEAEMALIGALLQNNRAYERVEEFLKPEHFANRIHGRLFEAIGKLRAKGVIADQITLRQAFDDEGDLGEVGGWPYIMQISHSVVSIINAEDYGRTIHDLYLRRQLIDIGEEIVNGAFASDIDRAAAAQIEEAERALAGLAGAAEQGDEPVPVATGVRELLEHIDMVAKADGGIIGVGTGISDLDRLLGGMLGGDLIVIAARPGIGKSDLLGCMLDNATSAGIPAAFFSLEMTRKQLAARSIARLTGIAASRQLKGNPPLTSDEWERVTDAANLLSQRPLFVDQDGGLTIARLRARARRLVRKHGVKILGVDYLQLMMQDRDDRSDNRVQEVSKITRGLKLVAKELDVPVIALSQLSRAVEARDDKRPHLADLRESGTIEQDADVAGFIYRESYYLEKSEPKQKPEENDEKFQGRHDGWKERCERAQGKAEVYFDKVRLGSGGLVELAYRPERSLFSGLYRGDL